MCDAAASGSAMPLEAERSLVAEGLMARMLTRSPAYRSVNGESGLGDGQRVCWRVLVAAGAEHNMGQVQGRWGGCGWWHRGAGSTAEAVGIWLHL